MQKLIGQLLSSFTSSWFYRDLCSKLAQPFNNPAFSFLLTALVFVILMLSAKEFIAGIIWRLRPVSQRKEGRRIS